MTFRVANVEALVEELPSEHHSTPLVAFDDGGWTVSEEVLEENNGQNPFEWNPEVFDEDRFRPTDACLNVENLAKNISDYMSRDDLKTVEGYIGRTECKPTPDAVETPKQSASPSSLDTYIQEIGTNAAPGPAW